MVIDPGYEIPRILALLAKHELTVKQILVTHAHIDHIASALELKQITGAPVIYNKADLALVAMMSVQAAWFDLDTPEVAPPDHSPVHGESLGVNGIATTILHTPGHTEGSLSVYVPQAALLLAGDTLFAGSVGRTDLPGGNHGKLIASIRERLLPLPAETVVVPGHGPDTTIGREKVANPFLS
jgi:glyoxylase-like metal-dependent hydrolase (beta-lactamase superfamily II)